MSANPRACRSLVFDLHDEPSAIAGDALEGLVKLKALRAQVRANSDALAGIDAAIEYLSQPHLRDFPVIILEAGELFGLGPTPHDQQMKRLLREIRTMEMEDVVHQAASPSNIRDWPTVWDSFLSFAPPNAVQAPINTRDWLISTTPSQILQQQARLPLCAAEAVGLDFENDVAELEAAVAALAALPNLSRLSLSDQTGPLPSSISALRNLRELVAGQMGLIELPQGFESLDRLEGLYLQCNAFNSFPEQLRSLKRLKTLSLWGNSIGEIPTWIGELQSLEDLLLDECGLSRLPDELFTLPALKRLEVSRNPALRTLPASVGNLQALKRLSVYECDLRELPESVSRLSAL